MVPLWTTGYFGGKNRESFKFVHEQEFMEEMKVRYKKEEREIGLRDAVPGRLLDPSRMY